MIQMYCATPRRNCIRKKPDASQFTAKQQFRELPFVARICVGDTAGAQDIVCPSVADLFHTDMRREDTVEDMERRQRKFGCQYVDGLLRIVEVYQESDADGYACGVDPNHNKWCTRVEAFEGAMTVTTPDRAGSAAQAGELPSVGEWACATAGQRNFACKSIDDLRRFDELALSMDYEAEAKWRDEKVATDQCVELGDGKMVMVEGRGGRHFA
jgi:hypothetical protein